MVVIGHFKWYPHALQPQLTGSGVVPAENELLPFRASVQCAVQGDRNSDLMAVLGAHTRHAHLSF